MSKTNIRPMIEVALFATIAYIPVSYTHLDVYKRQELFFVTIKTMTNPILKDGERIDQLFSTDVKIIQNKEVFSYSIDSVLLSRFPKIPKKGLIVDLCSGNGAVGLFASTRTEAPITLVELQERLADMAKRSVTLNQLENQVTVVNDDLKNLLDHAPRSQVDLILCNPPYFKATETSKKNLSEHYLLRCV